MKTYLKGANINNDYQFLTKIFEHLPCAKVSTKVYNHYTLASHCAKALYIYTVRTIWANAY